MLTKVSLFSEYSIAQTRVLPPEDCQRFAEFLRTRLDEDLVLPGGKISQETCDVEGDHKQRAGLRKNAFGNQPRMQVNCEPPGFHRGIGFGQGTCFFKRCDFENKDSAQLTVVAEWSGDDQLL